MAKSKKKVAKKVVKKQVKKVERDKFGSIVGSPASKINAVLSKTTPKTMKRLVKAAGVTGTYYDHLNSLIKAGKVKRSEKDGKREYALKQ